MRLSSSGVKATDHPWAVALGLLRPAIPTPQNRKETLQPYDLLRDRCCLPAPAHAGAVPILTAHPVYDSLCARRAAIPPLTRC